MDETDLTKENMRRVMDEYIDVVCSDCQERLKVLCEPIAKKLNAGKKPGVADMMRLVNGLCPRCLAAVSRRKQEIEARR